MEKKTAIKNLVVYMSKGHIVRTSFNGTCADAIGYYIGKQFNVGVEDDLLVYGHAIEIDGIAYNPSTHRYIGDRAHEKNLALLAERIKARDEREGVRVGDFIKLQGVYMRATHDWGDGMQTTCTKQGDATNHGGFYLCKSGGVSYSGSLDPQIEKAELRLTDETRLASFWFFNEDYASAHNGISVKVPCRVYELNVFDSARPHNLRAVYHDGTKREFSRCGAPFALAKEFVGKPEIESGKTRIIESLQFHDGERYMTYKTTAKALSVGAWGYAVDHGEPKGLELYSKKAGGSKWFTDARRVQIIELCKEPTHWLNLVAREF